MEIAERMIMLAEACIELFSTYDARGYYRYFVAYVVAFAEYAQMM